MIEGTWSNGQSVLPQTSGWPVELNWSDGQSGKAIFLYVAAGGPANLKALQGLAKANIKSIQGLAIGSVKSLQGLS